MMYSTISPYTYTVMDITGIIIVERFCAKSKPFYDLKLRAAVIVNKISESLSRIDKKDNI